MEGGSAEKWFLDTSRHLRQRLFTDTSWKVLVEGISWYILNLLNCLERQKPLNVLTTLDGSYLSNMIGLTRPFADAPSAQSF